MLSELLVKLTNDEIHVELSNGGKHVVLCTSWNSISYEYDREARKLKKRGDGEFILNTL